MNQNAQDVLKLADNMLATQGIPRIHAPEVNATPQQRLGNLRWRIDRILNPQTDDEHRIVADEVALGRFVGFVQGVLYDAGLLTLSSVDDQARAIRSGFNPAPQTVTQEVDQEVAKLGVTTSETVAPTSPLLPQKGE